MVDDVRYPVGRGFPHVGAVDVVVPYDGLYGIGGWRGRVGDDEGGGGGGEEGRGKLVGRGCGGEEGGNKSDTTRSEATSRRLLVVALESPLPLIHSHLIVARPGH